ncbi:pyruvate, phosphate dikinase [compost metagenome]
MATKTYLWDVDNIDPSDTSLFGGKAAGLARMRQMSLPVPPAVVISTDAFRAFRDAGGRLPESLKAEIDGAIHLLEAKTGKVFCGTGLPLLLSVRSGAKISMPGMMDTILNLGLDAKTAASFAETINNGSFVGDTWVRFWAMYADTVLGIDSDALHEELLELVAAEGSALGEKFGKVEQVVQQRIREETGEDAPLSPLEQLESAVMAVFESWDSPRAKAYRKHHGIPDDLGTAVVIQAMVFGNLDQSSGTGVAFTRDPVTGASHLFGEYLAGHQGEDLVAGTKTPDSLSEPSSEIRKIADEVASVGARLEALYKDALDIEFTVERGTLHLLQVRSAKRTAAAAVRMAVEMANEGLISREEAIRRVSDDQLRQLVRPSFLPEAQAQAKERGDLLLEGVAASPGHAAGVAVLDSDRATERAEKGEDVILVRPTTSPLDVRGMLHSQGIVTARGGSASHAAVVARALDKPCIVGCGTLEIDLDALTFRVGERQFKEGDKISIDGKTGQIYAGEIPMGSAGSATAQLTQLLEWADGLSDARVWASTRTSNELASLAGRKAAGVGIVPVVDLLIASGRATGVVEAVQALSASGVAPTSKVEERFEGPVLEACREFLTHSHGLPTALRLPRLGGVRARHMVDGWSALDPKILLPLGAPRLTAAFLRAISAAAKELGTTSTPVSVILPAASSVAELFSYKKLVAQHESIVPAALVQNAALLFDIATNGVDGLQLWIDLAEILRTFNGWPDELAFSADTVDQYAQAGNFKDSPLRRLSSVLTSPLQKLANAAVEQQRHVIVDLGANPTTEMVADLRQMGFTDFAVPVDRVETLRLSLGRSAVVKPA